MGLPSLHKALRCDANAEGHRIIAHLAYERLTPKAKAQNAELVARAGEQGTLSCPVTNLEDASTWPDCIRPLQGRWEYLAPMHYVDNRICGAEPPSEEIVVREGEPPRSGPGG